MAKLHVINGPYKGQSFDLKGESLTIGRSGDNSIQIKDLSVSRNHIKILKKDNKFYVQDLGSTNGTYIHGQRIESGKKIEVKEGLPIVMGKIMICLGKAGTKDTTQTLETNDLSTISREKGTVKEAMQTHEMADLESDLSIEEIATQKDRPNTQTKNM